MQKHHSLEWSETTETQEAVDIREGICDRGASQTPAVLGTEHRDSLAASSGSIADELCFIEDDTVPLRLRHGTSVEH